MKAGRDPFRSHHTDNRAIAIGRPSLVPKRDTLKQHLDFDRKVRIVSPTLYIEHAFR